MSDVQIFQWPFAILQKHGSPFQKTIYPQRCPSISRCEARGKHIGVDAGGEGGSAPRQKRVVCEDPHDGSALKKSLQRDVRTNDVKARAKLSTGTIHLSLKAFSPAHPTWEIGWWQNTFVARWVTHIARSSNNT